MSKLLQSIDANNLSGFPMGMNPMANMFGGFGGPNGGMNGMNGMNMGMNFNPNMFGAYQNNMWQNSNQNAFSGMGNDFSPGFNFNQQQNYPNGDFQSGYYGRGRGRGRGRGGFRARGNFNQYQNQNRFNTFQNANEQQQYDIQNMQSQMSNHRLASRQEPAPQPKEEEPQPDDDEFAPGGQEEVQEALGDDYVKKDIISAETTETPATPADEAASEALETQQNDIAVTEVNGIEDHTPDKPTPYVHSSEPETREEERKPIAEAYEEDLDMAMPPPSAPSGPSGRYGEKDYGFRARGHGRYPRSRGSIHLTNGLPPSPVRASSSNSLPRPESAGTGVVGAPTGPKAMREPPPKPSRQSSTSGGFQIMGRASMTSSRLSERDRSLTPNGYDDNKSADRASKRQASRSDRENGRLEDEQDTYGRDRRHHKSKPDQSGDYDMQDAENAYSRSSSRDRSKSHKPRRDRDKDKYGAESRHSSRRHREENADGDYDMNDYGDPVEETDSKPRSHRRHRDEKDKYSEDRDRERERDRDRERDKPRDKDRKRSRHERDYEEDEDYDRRHRSSKHHKKEHAKELELTINGRSSSRRESQVPTPAATPTSASKEAEKDKDPYTLEREARQKERMLKEDQRREKAANAKASGMGRRVSYKTEEDAQRGMEERESAVRAARWR